MSEEWSGVMQSHAKSFHLATLFFPKRVETRVRALYALCRWIDDAVDECPDAKVAEERLNKIRDDLTSPNSTMEVNALYKRHQLDTGYMEDLIEGARDDLQRVRIADEKEFIQYCYKVAGTVGLAMADLMGVTEKKARAFAVDLGIAMQITNICRDVKEDAEQNRVYLPETLLKKHGLTTEQLLTMDVDREKLAGVMREMVALGDRYYFSARGAFPSIPWRARGAILIASELYRGIGLKLIKNGGDPLEGRTMLNTMEKMGYLAKGIGLWAASLLWRPHLTHEPQLHTALSQWKARRGFAT